MAGGHAHPDSRLYYQLEPPLADRVVLETAPRERTVKSYSTTRAAHRALSLLTGRYESGAGGFFWISAPPGAGKTHFLNFLIALRLELGKAGRGGRELMIALDYPQA